MKSKPKVPVRGGGEFAVGLQTLKVSCSNSYFKKVTGNSPPRGLEHLPFRRTGTGVFRSGEGFGGPEQGSSDPGGGRRLYDLQGKVKQIAFFLLYMLFGTRTLSS